MDPLTAGLILVAATAQLGWMGWVTKYLIDIKSTTAGNAVTLEDHNERLTELEHLAPRHIPISR